MKFHHIIECVVKSLRAVIKGTIGVTKAIPVLFNFKDGRLFDIVPINSSFSQSYHIFMNERMNEYDDVYCDLNLFICDQLKKMKE